MAELGGGCSIRISNQSPNRQQFNPMNSSIQFMPDLSLDNFQLEEQFSPFRSQIKKGILKTFYFQDPKRKKTVGCNIYVNEMTEQQLQLSKKGKICRICIGEEETSRFINPCACKGSLQFVHEECLKLWILQKNGIEDVFKDKISCELCSQKFSMRLEIHNQFKLSRFNDIQRHQKCCWLIQVFFIIGIISTIIALIFQFGFTNVGVDAVMTLLTVLTVILITYLIASVVSFHQIEMIENWIIHNYRPRKDTKQSVFQLSSQMGQSVTGSPIVKKKTVLINPTVQTSNLQVIQLNQMNVSTNLSEL